MIDPRTPEGRLTLRYRNAIGEGMILIAVTESDFIILCSLDVFIKTAKINTGMNASRATVIIRSSIYSVCQVIPPVIYPAPYPTA